MGVHHAAEARTSMQALTAAPGLWVKSQGFRRLGDELPEGRAGAGRGGGGGGGGGGAAGGPQAGPHPTG